MKTSKPVLVKSSGSRPSLKRNFKHRATKFKPKPMIKNANNTPTESKTRKELRKEKRKDKKAKKHLFLLTKVGKVPEVGPKKKRRQNPKTKRKNAKARRQEKHRGSGNESEGSLDEDQPDLKQNEVKLKKQMEETRRKRLLEDNEKEDRNIKSLQKKLKLNKKAKIPESFRVDGLDYLLEFCDNLDSKNKSKEASESGEDEDMKEDSELESAGSDEGSGQEDSNDEPAEGSESDNSDEEQVVEKKEKLWEDIYGRMRDHEGNVVDDKAGEILTKPGVISAEEKYVPPNQRKTESNRDRIKKTLKGLLNRLSESNMHSISNEIETLYMTHSRNEMNQTLLELFTTVLVRPVLSSERIVLEHVMLIAVLHANVGSEVGAFFIQNFVERFHTLYGQVESLEDNNKELENLTLLYSIMYHFKIIDCSLIYDLLNFLASTFSPKDIELILTILRTVGFRLRKDDPGSLKSLILVLQQKASSIQTGGGASSRVKFMLEILLAIRNNNMSKIPNYDPTFGEHLIKIIKTFLHKGNYISELKISMRDLLNAETKGKWWIVGSAWINNTDNTTIDSPVSTTVIPNEKLFAKARAQGMNTDTRRNIFCILMTAEDYLDAFEKLIHLGLKNQLEREIVHVIVYCCLHEKKFNPYYAHLSSKFCELERRFVLTFQYTLWDRLKDFSSLTPSNLTNMSQLLVHLINERSLPLTVLKVIEFSDMNQVKLKFLKQTMSGILLQKSTDNLEELFIKTGLSDEKLNMFRESLKLFMGHFMRKGEDHPAGTLSLLKERVKLAQRAMAMGGNSKYPSKFKTEIGQLANILGQRRTARMFGVDQRRVFEWVTLLEEEGSEDESSDPYSSSEGTHEPSTSSQPKVPEGPPKFSPRASVQILNQNIETKVYEWVQSRLPLQTSSTQIRNMARDLYHSSGQTTIQCSYGWYRRWSKRYAQDSFADSSPLLLVALLQLFDNNELLTHDRLQTLATSVLSESDPNFKGSRKWADRFLKKHYNWIHWEGHPTQALPFHLEAQALEFIQRVNGGGGGRGLICCMDEVPITFSTNNDEEQLLLDHRRSYIRRACVKRCEATALMALLSDGTLLTPMIIVKSLHRTNINKIYTKKDNPILAFYGPSTEPSRLSLEKWFDLTNQEFRILLWDSYDVHGDMKTKCDQLRIHVEVFPLGTAAKLQPINVWARKEFLASIESNWIKYMERNMSDKNVPLPSTNELVDWVYTSYRSLKGYKDKLRESFNTVGYRFS